MTQTRAPERLKALEPFWGNWRIDGALGGGTYGSVYRITQTSLGETFHAAMKWIPIPGSDMDVNRLKSQGIRGKGIDTYFSELVSNLQREIRLLSALQGNSNIVSYQDHSIFKRKDGIGYDILIKMELLTGLEEHLARNHITQQDVVRLGVDLCSALILCQKKDIIHRDIKPANIFLSANGDFKLGDFGIARQMEPAAKFMTAGQGTFAYMAPEVRSGDPHYGSDVDMYSLGLVMYQLLNANRGPFMPSWPEGFSAADEERALGLRFNGEPLPRPPNGNDRLWEIIRRACAFKPEDRYSGPVQMREELAALLDLQEGRGTLTGFQAKGPTRPSSLADKGTRPVLPGDKWLEEDDQKDKPSPVKHKRLILIAGLLVLVLLTGSLVLLTLKPSKMEPMVTTVGPHNVLLAWQDTDGPYLISAVQEGRLQSSQETHAIESSLTLEGMVPGVSYSITVKDEKTGLTGTVSVMMPDAKWASNTEIACEYANFGTYWHSDLSAAVDFSSLASAGRYTLRNPDTLEFILTPKPIASQETGYLLIYKLAVISETLKQLPLTVQLVLRFDRSGAYAVSKTYDPGQAGVSDAFDIDEVLKQAWDELGLWPDPEEGLRLELYAGGLQLWEKPAAIRHFGSKE